MRTQFITKFYCCQGVCDIINDNIMIVFLTIKKYVLHFKANSHRANMFPVGFRSVIFKSHTHDSNVESIKCFLWFDHGYGSTFEIRVAPSLTI